MDNNDITDGTSMVGPKPVEMPAVDAAATQQTVTGDGIPALPAAPPEKKQGMIVETIILVVVSLIAVASIVFAVYYYLQWDDAQSNVDGKVSAAEAEARASQQQIDEKNFAEREKQPYLRFTGPSDYGALSFTYPRTWSIYVAKDAVQGGDFEAYFNPAQVNPVLPNSINALRLTIINRPIDNVRTAYDSLVKSGKLSHSVFQVGPIAGDRYDGEFSVDITGMMVMFKVNDKTATLRADAMVFKEDFETLIKTITLN